MLLQRALLSISCLSCLSASASAMPQQLGEIKVANPSFLNIVPSREAGASELIITSFAMFGGNDVTRITLEPDSLDKINALKSELITNKIKWPNNVTAVPDAVFGANYLSVGGGFLTPGNTTGTVAIVNTYSGEEFSIVKPKQDYFYHKILWVDMNGDGRLDALTARATKPIFGPSEGELLWLEQPADHKKGVWTEHVIAKGPDVNFVVADLAHDGSMQILSTQFFSNKLSLWWRDGDRWQSRVIDDTLGAAFDLSLVDLNNDGRADLLVTNHEGNDNGAIFGYEIPEDFKKADWPRHTLLGGIKTKVQGFNQAAPGTALAWFPASGKKPNILAAGDGSGQVHMLTPTSEDPADWSYQADVLLDTDGIIGQLAMGGVRADGSRPLFVPGYDANKIYVFNLQP